MHPISQVMVAISQVMVAIIQVMVAISQVMVAISQVMVAISQVMVAISQVMVHELHFKKQHSPACSCACIDYFDHVEFLLDTAAGQDCPAHSGTNNTTYTYSWDQRYKLMRGRG